MDLRASLTLLHLLLLLTACCSHTIHVDNANASCSGFADSNALAQSGVRLGGEKYMLVRCGSLGCTAHATSSQMPSERCAES